MTFVLWLLVLLAAVGAAYLLLVRTIRHAIGASHPFALSAELSRESGELQLIVRHLGEVRRVSVTSLSVDRDFAERVGLEPPLGFAREPYANPDRSGYEVDLEELAESGVELTDEAIERETKRQFEADEESVRTLNQTTVHYSGRIYVPSCQTTVLKFRVSRVVPTSGTLLVGYSHRVGLGAVDSGQSIKIVFSRDPSAEGKVADEEQSGTTAAFLVAPAESER